MVANNTHTHRPLELCKVQTEINRATQFNEKSNENYKIWNGNEILLPNLNRWASDKYWPLRRLFSFFFFILSPTKSQMKRSVYKSVEWMTTTRFVLFFFSSFSSLIQFKTNNRISKWRNYPQIKVQLFSIHFIHVWQIMILWMKMKICPHMTMSVRFSLQFE